MPGLRIVATVTALLALAVAPAAAQATVTSTQITNWSSQNPTAPPNDPYLISFDNPPNATTLTVSGNAPGATNSDRIDVVCYFGAFPSVVKLATGIPVQNNGTFTTGAVPLKPIAGHACRLRAIPVNTESSADGGSFAAQHVAVSEAALPVAISSGPNAGTPFNFYVNDVTFTGYAVWSAAGTPPESLPNPYTNACGGPEAAVVDPAFDLPPIGPPPNFAIDCAGSLLSDDLGAFGGRSEVQVDGRNAYDPAAAQSLFTSGTASQDLQGFPKTLAATVEWDPTTGLISSHSVEPWVICNGSDNESPTSSSCPSFVASGAQLERDITTSDGGRVVTMTDTWSSTDGQPHTLDLLYDDAIGVVPPYGNRGYEFPGQTVFSQYGTGNTLPGPSSAPGSILVRTDVTAPDGDPTEAAGAITFGTAPSGFVFTANYDFEEHQVLTVPAGASAGLTYIYSVGDSVADAQALALRAQDNFQGPALAITSPAPGTTVSNPTLTLSGTVTSGSGITSLSVRGNSVSVGPGGAWSTQVTLSPGTSTITARAIDGAGESAQAQVAVVYSPPPTPMPSSQSPAKCKVPTIERMKLRAAEKALRRAHCKVGRIKHETSRTVRSGRVASTTPRAGRKVKAGSKIELFVSKGR
jgi:PASTA domain/Glucodextranase, domain B